MRFLNGVVMISIVLGLCSCSMVSRDAKSDAFAGDWTGSGTDSQGNAFVFAARVIALGQNKYRMLVLDSLDSQKEPMHVMDGVLTDGTYTYTADTGLYRGQCTLGADTLEGYYKGPVDGTFKMQRVTQ